MSVTQPKERSVGHWAGSADHHGRPTAQQAPPPQSSTCNFPIGSRRRFDEEWLRTPPWLPPIIGTIPATIFFGRERERERESRTGKQNRYYEISGTKYFDQEYGAYDRESRTQNGKIHVTSSYMQLEKIVIIMHIVLASKIYITRLHSNTDMLTHRSHITSTK